MKRKHLILSLIVSLFTLSLTAQSIEEGMAVYKQEVNVHASLTGEQVAMKSFIPEFMYSKIELQFKGDQAKLSEIQEKQQGVMMMSNAGQNMLMDKNEKKERSYHILGDEKFYVESNFDINEKLELLTEVKEIGSYTCKSAKLQTEEGEMIIWYCPELPNYFSPIGLIAVEGLVMEITGERISYFFQSIVETKIEAQDLVNPEGYTLVTEDQLTDLTEEYMEEMQKNMH